MKRSAISMTMVFFLILALVLLLQGIVMIFVVFREYDTMIYLHTDHAQLMEMIRSTSFRLMAGMSMVVAGLGIGLILFLHLIRGTARLRREALALQRRNVEMEELNRQTRELAHHQRLETIGTLTSSIAHEFNNLLTPIMGYSMLALEKLPAEEEELYEDILEIYNASREAKNIISRLSDLSRKNTDMSFRQVSPDELVQKTMSVAAPAKPMKVNVKLNLNSWGQRIRANEIQLSQLLLNLILNGFHAMEQEGGTLTVDTSFDEKYIHIRVADTGCGIPQEHLPQIFQPFFTTKESGKGTGLGLAIVAQVVEDHQGKIRVDSRVGEGTAITVSLPRSL